MIQHTIVRNSMVVAVVLAAACNRPTTEDRQTSSAPPQPQPQAQAQPAQAQPAQAEPQPAHSAEPAQGPDQEQKVGVAETHGATTGGTAGATAPPLPTNLPPFEGELQMKTQGKAPESLDYAMKGDKIRLGISATPGKNDKGIDAIIDTTDKKATILLNDRKEFVEVDLGKLAEKAKTRIENVDVERTGRTETVSGRECEEWKIKDRDYQVTACVTEGAPYFDLHALEQQASFKAPSWVHRVVDEGYIPLRVSVSDASGKSLVSSQVTDTSRKVDASRFEVPVGYRKADASKLPGVPKP